MCGGDLEECVAAADTGATAGFSSGDECGSGGLQELDGGEEGGANTFGEHGSWGGGGESLGNGGGEGIAEFTGGDDDQSGVGAELTCTMRQLEVNSSAIF